MCTGHGAGQRRAGPWGHSPHAGHVLWHGLVLEVAGPRAMQAEGGPVDGGVVRTERRRILRARLRAARGQSGGRRGAGLGVALSGAVVAAQRAVVRAGPAARGQRRRRSVAVRGRDGRLHCAVGLQASVRARFCFGCFLGRELRGGKVPVTGGDGAGAGGTGCNAAVAQNRTIMVPIAHSHAPASRP